MERQLDKLTDEDIKSVKAWLNLSKSGKEMTCPFRKENVFGGYKVIYLGDCCKCKVIFPKLKFSPVVRHEYTCPCIQFGLEYVTKVAEEIVKMRG